MTYGFLAIRVAGKDCFLTDACGFTIILNRKKIPFISDTADAERDKKPIPDIIVSRGCGCIGGFGSGGFNGGGCIGQ